MASSKGKSTAESRRKAVAAGLHGSGAYQHGNWGSSRPGAGGFAASTGGGGLLRVIDVISRPLYMMAEGMKSGLHSIHEEGGLSEVLDPVAGLKGAWAGLSGKKKTLVSDILAERKGPWQKGKTKFIAGLIGDIALDPTTYLTFGAAPVGKAAATAAREGAEAAGRTGARRLAADIGREAATRGAPKALPRSADEFVETMTRMGGQKALPRSTDEFVETMSRMGGQRALPPGAPGAGSAFADAARATGGAGRAATGTGGQAGRATTDRLGDTVAKEIQLRFAGKRIAGSQAAYRGLKGASGALKATRGGDLLSETFRPSHGISKEFHNLQRMYSGRAQSLVGDVGSKIRDMMKGLSKEDDRLIRKAINGIDGASVAGLTREQRVVADWMVSVLDEMDKVSGIKRTATNASRFKDYSKFKGSADIWDRSSQNLLHQFDEFTRKYAHKQLMKEAARRWPADLPQIEQAMRKAVHVFGTKGENTSAWQHYLNAVQGPWKRYVTAYRPGFHIRNMLGDLFNNYLAGVNLLRYKTAGQVMRGVKDNVPIKLGRYSFRAGELDNYYRRAGLDTSYFKAEEIDRAVTGIGHKVTQLSEIREKFGRMTNFLDGFEKALNKGRSLDQAIEEAGQRTRKYLFDYADLTAAERKLRSVIPFYCVPEDHEILTRFGWVKYTELEIGQDVMALNHESGILEWVPLEGIAEFDFDGELWTFNRKEKSWSFTPDHRWPVETNWKSRKSIISATELNSDHKIPWTGEFVDTGDSILSSRLAAILGWVVTDGYYRWRGNHCEMIIYQHPFKFLEDVCKLVENRPRSPHPETGVCAVPVSLVDSKEICEVFQSKEDMPFIVGHLSREAAEAMWTAMFQAEGWVSANSTMGFAQNPGPVREAFQMLCYLTGRHAHDNGNPNGFYIGCSKFLRVKEGIGRIYYKGKIWCPQTKYGTWLMRHNGAVIPTGNTWTRKELPLILEHTLTSPGKMANVVKGTRTISQMLGVDADPDDPFPSLDGDLPEWLQDKLSIGLPGSRVASPGLPIDLLGMATNPKAAGTQVADMVSPFIKAPLELTTGKRFPSGNPQNQNLPRYAIGNFAPYGTLARENDTPLSERIWNLIHGMGVRQIS
ncbi:MAG: hypothetical protein ACRD8W_00455 [Nitrososphaeraceae archaeon]